MLSVFARDARRQSGAMVSSASMCITAGPALYPRRKKASKRISRQLETVLKSDVHEFFRFARDAAGMEAPRGQPGTGSVRGDGARGKQAPVAPSSARMSRISWHDSQTRNQRNPS